MTYRHPYDHFKPSDDLKKGLHTVRSTNTATFNINYHIVWIPKYRKAILGNDKTKKFLEEILRGQAESREWHVLALEIMPDHIHIFLSVPPTVPVSDVVKQLKGNSATQLRRIFPHLKEIIRDHLWARGYYVSTAGFISQDKVQKYIDEQQKHINEKFTSGAIQKEKQKQKRLG